MQLNQGRAIAITQASKGSTVPMPARPPTSPAQPVPPSGDRTEPLDISTVTTPRVACAGHPPPDDHPLIYLTFGDETEIVCPYCSRRFRLAEGVPPGPLHH